MSDGMEGFEDPEEGWAEPDRDLMTRLSDGARTLGLYLEVAAQQQVPSDYGSSLVIVAHFLVGDLAFSDEVQNPSRAKEEEAIRPMLNEVADAEMIRALKAIRDRKREN